MHGDHKVILPHPDRATRIESERARVDVRRSARVVDYSLTHASRDDIFTTG